MRPNLKITEDGRIWAFLARPTTHLTAAMAIGALMFGYVGYRWSDDHARALKKYQQDIDIQASLAANAASEKLSAVYNSLRAIARLSSVQAIERRASSLSNEDRANIQELYNSLASSFAVSEVYITSASFNPDRIDPKTRKPEEPEIVFDDHLANRQSDRQGDLRGTYRDNPSVADADHDTDVEAEIYEYRALRDQISQLRLKFPTAASVKGKTDPAISSAQFIACDGHNSKSKARHDADPTGIVYSVPVFGQNGRFGGVVSGVVLTRNIHAMLGDGVFRLSNPTTGFVSVSRDGTPPPKDILFQTEHKLSIVDEAGEWRVSGYGLRNVFDARDDVVAARQIALQGFGLASVLTLAFMLVARMHSRFANRAFSREANLDAMIRARTAELNAKVNESEAHRAALEMARADAIQASEAKSQFLANMSHELRTPLNAIIGFSDLMSQELRGPLGHPSYKGYAADIHNSGAHLLSLINDILDLSKIEAGRFELHESRFILSSAFNAAFKLLEVRAGSAGVRMHNQIKPDIAVYCDERAMQQIALNLLTNAVKFTPSGGAVHAQSFLDTEWLTIKVIDSGKGIAPEDIAYVFESFGQGRHDHAVKDRGTGLGLPIVKGLVEAHGGDIRLDSLPGRGTTVVLRLPARRVVPSVAIA